MSDDRPAEGNSNPSVPDGGDDEGGSNPSVPDTGGGESGSGPTVPSSGDGEGNAGPTVPNTGDPGSDTGPTVPNSGNQESGPGGATDANSGDGTVHDPAGVGDHPEGDSAGLSGQPDADEFEGAADWSDVDGSPGRSSNAGPTAGGPADPPAVDSETRIDPAGANARPGEASAGAATPAGEDRTGSAGGGRAGAAAGTGGAGTGGQRGPGEKYCSNCGTVISEQAVVCPECGVEQPDTPGQAAAQSTGGGNGSDPGVAALLSGIGFFIPLATGAGQVYNGQIGKGILFTLIQLVNVALAFVLIGLVTYPLVGILAIYDAYKNADG